MYYAQFLRDFGEIVLTHFKTYFSKINPNNGFYVFGDFQLFCPAASRRCFGGDANKRLLSGSVLRDDEIP